MFFGCATRPEEVYRCQDVPAAQNLSHGLSLTNATAFSVSLTVNLLNDHYTGRLFGNSDFSISLSEYPRITVTVTVGGSVSVAAEEITAAIQARLQSSFMNAQLGFSYSGSGDAGGIQICLNGVEVPVDTKANGSMNAFTNGPFTLGGGSSPIIAYSAQVVAGVLSEADFLALSEDPRIHASALWSFQASQRYRKAGFLADFEKKYFFSDTRERRIDPGLYGGEAAADLSGSGAFQGPVVNGYNSNNIFYAPALNRTYVSTMAGRGSGFARDGFIGYYDHADNYFSYVAQVKARTRYSCDNHQKTPMVWTMDDAIITGQEDLHCANPRISRIDPDQGHEVTVIGDIGTTPVSAYLNLKLLNDDLILHCRTCSPYYQQQIFRSGDNGLTWDGGHILVDLGTADYWAYPRTYCTGTRLYCVIHWRDQSGAGTGRDFFRMSCVWSEDGVNFTTINGQVSRDITQGPFPAAELAADGFLFQTKNPSGLDNLALHGRWEDESGVMHYIIRDAYDEGRYHVACDRASDPVETHIPNAESPALRRPLYLGNGAIECITEDTSQGIMRFRRGRTLDYWATPPEVGDFITPDDVDLFVFIPALDYTPTEPYLLAGNYIVDFDTETTAMWLGEYIIPPLT